MADLGDEHSGRPDLLKKRARLIIAERVWRLLTAALVGIAILTVAFDIHAGSSARHEILDRGNQNHDQTRNIAEYAAYCADRDGSQTVVQIQRCVAKQLASEKGR